LPVAVRRPGRGQYRTKKVCQPQGWEADPETDRATQRNREARYSVHSVIRENTPPIAGRKRAAPTSGRRGRLLGNIDVPPEATERNVRWLLIANGAPIYSRAKTRPMKWKNREKLLGGRPRPGRFVTKLGSDLMKSGEKKRAVQWWLDSPIRGHALWRWCVPGLSSKGLPHPLRKGRPTTATRSLTTGSTLPGPRGSGRCKTCAEK
jgi:hypothetical protein